MPQDPLDLANVLQLRLEAIENARSEDVILLMEAGASPWMGTFQGPSYTLDMSIIYNFENYLDMVRREKDPVKIIPRVLRMIRERDTYTFLPPRWMNRWCTAQNLRFTNKRCHRAIHASLLYGKDHQRQHRECSMS